MITCQHEWVEQCLIKYRFESLPEGEHWEDAHYPLPECLGGIETVSLWSRDHAVHGFLQSEDLDQVCFHGYSRKTDRALIEKYYPEYLELCDQWFSEAQGRAGKRRGEASFRNKSGIHDPSYRNSPEYKDINSQAGKNGGEAGKQKKSGIHDPAYRSSAEYAEMRSRVGKKLVERKIGIHDPETKRKQNQKVSKPVIFHYPSGEVVSFPSRMEAIRQTRISSSTLVRVLLNGNAIGWGRFRGVKITEGGG